MATLSLQTRLAARELVGALFWTLTAPASSPVIKALQRTGTDYHNATKGNAGHTIGPRFVHVLLS